MPSLRILRIGGAVRPEESYGTLVTRRRFDGLWRSSCGIVCSTRREVAYTERRANRYECYAARVEAKEAGMKALGTGWRGGLGGFPLAVWGRRRKGLTP